jgi:hypothetical protein
MGRYYSGDINGKFGFACQSSDDGEYFGAFESTTSHIPYTIPYEEIPEALEKLKALIEEYNRDTKGTGKADISMTQEEFWDTVDNKQYQDSVWGLLCGRISMGLAIARFNEQYPDSDINFEAEL